MPNLNGTFDANSVEPSQSFDPIPAGWYPAMITGSEIKPSKSDPNNQYVQLTIDIIDGDHKGRKVWTNLNLWNANETAVEIAKRDMSAICRATGVMQVSDTEALHEKPMAVKLKIRPAKDGYEARNEACGYEPYAAHFGAGQTQQRPAQQFPAQAAPTGAPPQTTTPPWQS